MKKNFTQIDNHIIVNSALSSDEFRLLSLAFSMPNDFNLSQRYVRKSLNWSYRKTVQTFRKLKDKNILQMTKIYDSKGRIQVVKYRFFYAIFYQTDRVDKNAAKTLFFNDKQ